MLRSSCLTPKNFATLPVPTILPNFETYFLTVDVVLALCKAPKTHYLTIHQSLVQFKELSGYFNWVVSQIQQKFLKLKQHNYREIVGYRIHGQVGKFNKSQGCTDKLAKQLIIELYKKDK